MAATSKEMDYEIDDNDTESSDHDQDELEIIQTTATPNKKRKLEHPVWDYFEVKNDGVYCMTKGCRAKLALPKSTTNAGKHLRSHTILLSEYNSKLKSWKEETQSGKPSSSKNVAANKQPAITESFNKAVAKNFYHENSKRKHFLDGKLALCLAIPHISVNIFTHEFFQNLIHTLDEKYQMPSSFHGLKNLLNRKAVQIKKKLVDLLKSNSIFPPSLTVDLWSDRAASQSYLGVTIHFVRKDGNVLQCAFLGAKLMDKKTGVTIREETEELLEEYGYSMANVFKIVTDNGSNVVKAYEGHDKLIRTEFWLDNEENDLSEEFNPLLEHDYEEWEDENDEFELDFAFPKRLPCAAHIFENALLNAMKEIPAKECLKILTTLIGKFNRSVEAKSELRKYVNNRMITPSNTRWGYTIDVMERFIEIEKGVRKVADKKSWPFPSSEQIKYIQQLLPIIGPIKTILHEIQAEKFVSISNAYLYVKLIKSALEEAQKTRIGDNVKIVVNSLFKQIIERFKNLCDFSSPAFDPTYIMASCLDPNNAKLLSDEEISKGISYIIPFVNISETETGSMQENVPTTSNSSTLENLKARFFKERTRQNSGNLTVNSLVNEAIKAVMDAQTPLDPLAFWGMIKEELKPVRDFALTILAIPCTAAPIERIWSKAGSGTIGRRANTGSDLLNDQLMIYVNTFTNPDLF